MTVWMSSRLTISVKSVVCWHPNSSAKRLALLSERLIAATRRARGILARTRANQAPINPQPIMPTPTLFISTISFDPSLQR